MKAFCTLLKNELKLNIRNMNMVIFALLLPLVVLVILGFLYGKARRRTARTTPFWNSPSVRYAPSRSARAG